MLGCSKNKDFYGNVVRKPIAFAITVNTPSLAIFFYIGDCISTARQNFYNKDPAFMPFFLTNLFGQTFVRLE